MKRNQNESPGLLAKKKLKMENGTMAEKENGGKDEGEMEIDESLYSRQLYVMGHEAQKRMGQANVLVIGMNGLGVEIAKNVALAGVRSLTVHDDTPTAIADLGSQFYLQESDVGKPRSEPSQRRLAGLNEYVPVNVHSGNVKDKELLKQFKVVVAADMMLDDKVELNELCREVGACFIACQVNGLFAGAFCDFGDSFVVHDTNGEPPITRLISTIIQDDPAVVTVHEEARHGLETGDLVRFSEVKGMTELNDLEPVKITVKGPYTFEIPADTRKFSAYESGGYVHEVKQPRTMQFQPLKVAVSKPGDFLLTDFAKLGRSELLHFAFRALDKFRVEHKGAYPEPGNLEQCKEVVAYVEGFATEASAESEMDSDVVVLELDDDNKLTAEDRGVVMALASGSSAILAPMTAFLGGVVGQEVLKASSGKFSPLNQFLYFDACECLPDSDEPLPKEELMPQNCREDGEIAVFGKSFVEKLRKLNMFLVGAGAIGCEMLKNWALMGIASDPKEGMIHVTDMDRIERSNLNRQFLFRSTDVGSSKSTAAAHAVKEMNSAVKIKAYEDRVGSDTEHIFGDDFMASLDIVCTALDNLDARLYVDQRCLDYSKPMLESGTLGTKGNTQVVVPHLTENYGATRDPPEKSIPICTLNNFPYKIEHTIKFARDWFEGEFATNPKNMNQYMVDPEFVPRLDSQQNTKVEILKTLKASFVDEMPKVFADCVAWARLKFDEKFSRSIKQLLHSFPSGMLTSTGTPFWSGTKREPKPLEFDSNDPLHMGFIVSAANLRAAIYGIQGSDDEGAIKKALESVNVPEFKPKNIKIAANDEELKQQQQENQQQDMSDIDSVAKSLLAQIPPREQLQQVNEIEFDKDNDKNYHISVITAASNLRARNYDIAEASRHETKKIAGAIIPAIATTTALVTGLVCLELYKLAAGKKTVDAYKNGFCNLALPFFAFSEPVEVKRTVAGDLSWSIWDKIEIDGSENPLTLAEFLRFFQEKYNVEVNMLSYNVSILHSFFSDPVKKAERMNMTMPELVANVTKKPIDPGQRFLTFEIIAVDSNDQDVEFPPVSYRLR